MLFGKELNRRFRSGYIVFRLFLVTKEWNPMRQERFLKNYEYESSALPSNEEGTFAFHP